MTYAAVLVGAGRIGRIHVELYENAAGIDLVALTDGDSANRSTGTQGAHVVEAPVATFVSDATGSAVSVPLPKSLRSTRISTPYRKRAGEGGPGRTLS